MHRPSPVPQSVRKIDPNWRTGQRWHTPDDNRNSRVLTDKQFRRHYARVTQNQKENCGC
jgi:hypothetical protein